MPGPVVIFLRGADWEARYLAASSAITAAAMGDEVHLALFFESLGAWVGGRFDEGAPPAAATSKVALPSKMLEEARRELGLKVVACDTAVRLASLDPEAIAGRLDGVVGLPSLWRLGQQGRLLTF
jgi:peroxiredoxin family protein